MIFLTGMLTFESMAAAGQVKWCAWQDGKINITRTAAEIKATYDACPNGSIAVIAQTDPIPNTPFAVRQNLPQSFKDAVKAALLATKDNPDFIKAMNNWYVDPAPAMGLPNLDAFFNPIRDIAKYLNLDLKSLAG